MLAVVTTFAFQSQKRGGYTVSESVVANLIKDMSVLEGHEADEGEETARNVAAAAYTGKFPTIDEEVDSFTIMFD